MLESIVVAAIVLTAAAFLFNKWRKTTAPKKGCGGNCGCHKPKP